MTVNERIRNLLLLEKMEKDKETSDKLGLQDRTVILKSKFKNISGEYPEK